MDERPGRLNSGRITLLIKLPTSSSKPKSSSNGSSKPANRNTDSKVGISSFNTSPPVYSCQIMSIPVLLSAMMANAAPSTRNTSQGKLVKNRVLKKGLLCSGLVKVVITDSAAARHIRVVTIVGAESPSSPLNSAARMAMGMVTPPS